MKLLDCSLCRKDFHCGKCVCCCPIEKLERMAKKKIRRFPRIMQLNNPSMLKLWKTVEKVGRGESLTVMEATYLFIWRMEYLTQKIAKQSLRKGFDGHFRFPRVKV